MPKDNWVTYNRDQARQVSSGLQVLLDRGMLDSEEQGVARSVQRKLSFGKEEGVTQYPFNEKEYQLITQVGDVLWK